MVPPPSTVVDGEVDQVVPERVKYKDFDVVKPRRGRAKANGMHVR